MYSKCWLWGRTMSSLAGPMPSQPMEGGAHGVALYTKKIQAELADIMGMTGCRTIQNIDFSKMRIV